MKKGKTVLGAYGSWAASVKPKMPLLSLRRDEAKSLAAWRRKALAKALELVAPPRASASKVRVDRRHEYDGLAIEHISWHVGYGERTEAVLLKPAGAKGRLPGVLALHDHGGFKYYGWQKITRTGPEMHPLVVEHQKQCYGGVAWANELARRGYVVLVPDVFAFGSRRLHLSDVLGEVAAFGRESNSKQDINGYNDFARAHESPTAKALLCAGTTWPGVTFAEDRAALEYLLGRKDVDAARVACGGLSGGGLRTAYLAGLDHRVKAAICVGFMTTWDDFTLNTSLIHTWMTYTPLLPNYLDFPELFALRAPLPSLVQSCKEDPLYTMPEMRKADRMLKAVFAKAGAPGNYGTTFYPGGHKFDLEMQREAFDWLDGMMAAM